jgi:hypothetical protein
MTATSNNDLIAELKAARDNRDSADNSWANDLPDLPPIPKGKARQAIFIPKRHSEKGGDAGVHRGGPGSGHFGHAGRPGEVGGSLPSGEAAAAGSVPAEQAAPAGTMPDTIAEAKRLYPGLETANEDEAKRLTVQHLLGLAQNARSEAEQLESVTTPMMEDISKATGGQLEGLDFRLKGVESMARKIKDNANEFSIAADEAVSKIHDKVRYTLVFDREHFVDGVEQAQQMMQDHGWLAFNHSFKNYFSGGDAYDGYNTNMVNDHGQVMEVQYHTKESIQIKAKSWTIYERFRVTKSPTERKTMWDQMTALWVDYPKPPGWERLAGVMQ